MAYDDYILVHQKEREEADGCDMCKYEDRQPWEFPCIVCKRNCMDLYERDNERYGISGVIESRPTILDKERK